MKRVRWAVLGAGGIARRRTIPEGILPARNAELVAVYSPRSGEEVGGQFEVPAASSEEHLFEFNFDAVYVASPVDCHLGQVVMASSARRHVLCEKPLALSVDESQLMEDSCVSNGVILGVGFMMRYHPLHCEAARIIQRGEIGRIISARAQFSCWYPPNRLAWRQVKSRSGGGPLPDIATHCFDLLEMILGQQIVEVFCVARNQCFRYEVEDTAIVTLSLDGGAVATVDCSFARPDNASQNRLEVYGSQGAVILEDTLGQESIGSLRWLPSPTDENPLSGAREYEKLSSTAAQREVVNMYQAEIEAFGDAILHGSDISITGRQGVHIQQVLAACYQSARESCMVATSSCSTGSASNSVY